MFKRLLLIYMLACSIILSVQIFHRIPITYTLSVNGPLLSDNAITILKYKAFDFFLRNVVDNNDTVIILVDSPGGDSGIAPDFIWALQQTQGYTIAKVDKLAASYAAMILLNVDSIQVSDTANIMFHRLYSDVSSQTKLLIGNTRDTRWQSNQIENQLFSMLTSDEKTRFINGDDISLTGKEFRDRLRANPAYNPTWGVHKQ